MSALLFLLEGNSNRTNQVKWQTIESTRGHWKLDSCLPLSRTVIQPEERDRPFQSGMCLLSYFTSYILRYARCGSGHMNFYSPIHFPKKTQTWHLRETGSTFFFFSVTVAGFGNTQEAVDSDTAGPLLRKSENILWPTLCQSRGISMQAELRRIEFSCLQDLCLQQIPWLFIHLFFLIFQIFIEGLSMCHLYLGNWLYGIL